MFLFAEKLGLDHDLAFFKRKHGLDLHGHPHQRLHAADFPTLAQMFEVGDAKKGRHVAPHQIDLLQDGLEVGPVPGHLCGRHDGDADPHAALQGIHDGHPAIMAGLEIVVDIHGVLVGGADFAGTVDADQVVIFVGQLFVFERVVLVAHRLGMHLPVLIKVAVKILNLHVHTVAVTFAVDDDADRNHRNFRGSAGVSAVAKVGLGQKAMR